MKKVKKDKIYLPCGCGRINGWKCDKHSCGCRRCDYALPFYPWATKEAVHATHLTPEERKKPKTKIFIGTLDPKVREAGDLTKIYYPRENTPTEIKGLEPIQVYKWAERVRNVYEQEGEFITVHALIQFAQKMHRQTEKYDPASPDVSAVLEAQRKADLHVQTIKELYAVEYKQEVADREATRRAWEAKHCGPRDAAEEGAKNQFRNRAAGTVVLPVQNTAPSVEVRTTEGKGGGRRFWVFGHPVTAVIRWMGANAWTGDDVRAALKKLGIADVNDTTIQCQLIAGRKGAPDYGGRGEPAALTPPQEEALEVLVDDVPAPKVKKKAPKVPMKEQLDLYGQGKDPVKGKKVTTKKKGRK
jgi:hypothetical protein